MRVALAALAWIATAGSASSDTASLDVVRSVCFAHGANGAAIAAELSARGWHQIGEDERRQRDSANVGGGFSMHWATSRAWAPPDNSSLTLVLGEGPLGSGRADFCMVTESRAFADQVRAVRQWLDFDRFQTWGPGGDMFAYIRGDDEAMRNGAQASEAEREAAARTGRFGFVQVVGDDGASAINFSVVHPASTQ
jgi:hypothetical protein